MEVKRYSLCKIQPVMRITAFLGLCGCKTGRLSFLNREESYLAVAQDRRVLRVFLI